MILYGPTIQREYYLPDSALGQTLPQPPTSFGSRPTSSPVMSLWISAEKAEDISILFVANPPLDADIGTFGRYVLREFDPARLPVVIENWTPYRARVNSPVAAFLETPRMFLAGYAAIVNGRPAPVVRSPSGLVMMAVAAGENQVELTYPGSVTLRISYFVSLAAWSVIGLLGLFRMLRPARGAIAE